MENLNELKERINEINPGYLNLCSDFLVLFSRFEYALKEEGFLQTGTDAKASIQSYIQSIATIFNQNSSDDLRAAVNFILNDPPRKQIRSNDNLEWIVEFKEGAVEIQLLEYTRRIRNSLLHGAKFYGQIEANSRNWRLISSAMVIIEHWINLNQNLKNRFQLNN